MTARAVAPASNAAARRPGRPRADRLAPAGVALALLSLLALALAVRAVPGLRGLEAHAVVGLDVLRWPTQTGIAEAVARLSGPPATLVATTALLASALLARRAWLGVAAVLTVLGAGATTQLLKRLLAHQEFHAVLADRQVSPEAFPSGHATAAMALALAATMVAPAPRRRLVAVVAAALVTAQGLAMLTRWWHLPADVLAGQLVAAAWSFALLAAVQRMQPRRLGHPIARSRAWRAVTGPALLLVGGVVAGGGLLAVGPATAARHLAAHPEAAAVAALVALCSCAIVGATAAVADRDLATRDRTLAAVDP